MLSDLKNIPDGWREIKTDNLLIKRARLIDPAVDLDRTGDLLIKDGIIQSLDAAGENFDGEVIDIEGLIVCPGLFDMHTHLREPGFEHKETVQSGCRAAAAGGFTGITAMPNTEPVIDNPGVVDLVRSKAKDLPVEVHPIASVTKGRQGETLSELAELFEAGVRGFSDDGSPVSTAVLLRLAIEYAQMFDAIIIEHCEEPTLTADGMIDEGFMSTSLGLPGWPSIGEDIDVYRCLRIAEFTKGRVHIAHVSTAEAVRLIRDAKARGVKITAEATPHHLTLDSRLLETYNSDLKVNPPLRSREDVEAVIEGLADGTIDVIATDHAPHAPDEKEVEFIYAPFGMIGLETALGVVITKLVKTGRVSLNRVIDAMTAKPRSILNLPPVRIETGQSANLTIFNQIEQWTVDRNKMASKAKNTPFHGWELEGKALGIVNRGKMWIRES